MICPSFLRPMGKDLALAGRRHDGTEFPVEVGLSYIEREAGPLVVCFVSDITERVQAKEALRDSETRCDSSPSRRRTDARHDGLPYLSHTAHRRIVAHPGIGGKNLLDEPAVAGIVVNTRDVTERERRHRELEAIVDVSSALRNAATAEEMPPIILNQLLTLLEVHAAALLRCDGDDTLYVTLGGGAWEEQTGRQLSDDETIIREATWG